MVLMHPLDNEELVNIIQNDINGIHMSLQSLSLQLNVKKCKFMVFSLSPLGPMGNISLKVGQEELERTTTYKYLGVEMDQRLTFARQTQMAIIKTKQAIGALSRSIRKWASAKILSTAIQTIALPILLYAIEIWYPPGKREQISIEKIQKYGARLITNNFDSTADYEALLVAAHCKPIYRIVAERRMIFLKKYMDGNKFLPEGIFRLKTESENRVSARLGSRITNSLQLEINSQQKNGREENLAAARIIALWNSLNESIIRMRPSQFKVAVQSEEGFGMVCNAGAVLPVRGV
jgi:hypothetical protein